MIVQQLILVTLPVALFAALSGWWLRDAQARTEGELRRALRHVLVDGQGDLDSLIYRLQAAGVSVTREDRLRILRALSQLEAEGWTGSEIYFVRGRPHTHTFHLRGPRDA